jgi:hypothetical protein
VTLLKSGAVIDVVKKVIVKAFEKYV